MSKDLSLKHLGIRGLPILAEEKPPRLGGDEFKVLRPYLRPYRAATLAALILLLTTTGLRLVAPILFYKGIDHGIVLKDPGALRTNGLLFLATAVASFFTLRASALLMGKVGQSTLRDLRMGCFQHLASLSLGFFERERSGRLVARVTNDAEAVEKLVTDELVRILAEVTFLVGAGVILFFLDLRLAAAAFSVLPFIVLATFAFQKKAKGFYQDLRERVATVLSFFQETLRGVHVVRAFAQERTSARQFEEVNDAWGTAKIGTLRLSAEYFARVDLLSSLGTAIVLIYGGSRVLNGDLTIGKLFSFVVFLAMFFDPLHHLSERYTTFQSAMAGLARLAQLFQVKPEIVDHSEPVTLNTVHGNIKLQNVDFRYNRAGPLALQDVSIEVLQGETLALVGPTGAGKSTIIKLLARFYDVTEGSILIDGLDLRRISLENLRRHMALVPQEGFLFGGTIADNIRFGSPHATDRQIEQVCIRLGIDEFIRGLPEGYETQVRERGARLAAGEKQLIALARALIASPSIILLDEATSSLDSATEAKVQGAFQLALVGRTSVVIAHRLSTVMHADKIAVVEQGKIVEAGTHSQLVSKQGRYAALYESWLLGGSMAGQE